MASPLNPETILSGCDLNSTTEYILLILLLSAIFNFSNFRRTASSITTKPNRPSTKPQYSM